MAARAKPKPLRRLHFEPDIDFLPRDGQGRLQGEARDIALALDAACAARFLAFAAHAENTLRRARQPVGETGIREVMLRLSADPTDRVTPDPVRHGWAIVDIACDPRGLLSLPDDGRAVGERVIARGRTGA